MEEAGSVTASEAQENGLTLFGKRLAAALIVFSDQKDAAFNNSLARSKARMQGAKRNPTHEFHPRYNSRVYMQDAYNTKWTDEEFSRLQAEMNSVLTRVTTLDGKYSFLDKQLISSEPSIRVQRVFHGTKSFTNGIHTLLREFAPLQATDNGYFGAACYFTPDLDYALKFATPTSPQDEQLKPGAQLLPLDPKRLYHVVLVCDVQYANPFPVMDACAFKGSSLAPGHDAHVAVVKFPTDPQAADAVPFQSSSEWRRCEADVTRRPVAEVAISDISAIIVRAVLVFDAQ